MEVDDDFEDTNITTCIITKKKKCYSTANLASTKDDSFHLSDNDKKTKKRKKKSKSKKKETEKMNKELENKEEEDNDALIVIGNLILNKKRNKERKEKERKVKFKKDSKRNIDEYIKKVFNNEELSIEDKFGILICVKILNKILNIFKIIYLFNQIRQYQKNACSKIGAIYKAYLFRKKFKMNYLILKIINLRNLYASKITAHLKGYIIRKNIKKILEKKEDNYIIYSTLSDNRMIYFKIKYDNNFEDNIYFEYCKVLNCFIFYLSQKEKNLSKKKISGFFYNERYNKLTDDLYEKNEKGENVINFPKIIKKNNKNIDKYDKIINEFMKNNRYKKRKIYDLDEYEENKRKAMDDDMIQNKKNLLDQLEKISRSKSYMRLKGAKKTKSILKPSKSYINLKSEERKIQFGKAKILGYHLNKKYLS
jgi:hypothetical protein